MEGPDAFEAKLHLLIMYSHFKKLFLDMLLISVKWNTFEQLERTLPSDRDADVANGLGLEPGFAVAKIILVNVRFAKRMTSRPSILHPTFA